MLEVIEKRPGIIPTTKGAVHRAFLNDLVTGLLGPYQEIRSPIFLVRLSLQGPCVKVSASYFLVPTE